MKTANIRRDRNGHARFLACLLFAVLFTACLTGAGCCESDLQVVSSSGDLNRTLAVDLIGKTDGYSAVLYDNRSGLPTSEANAITQTGDGFIWIGSYAGLIRYDGCTFERQDSTGGLTSIKCLYVDSRDRLWIGTNDNGAAMMERGELRTWGKAEGMKSLHTRAITEDSNGTVYIATTCGIAMIDPEGNLAMMEDDDAAEANMLDLRTGNDGIVYGLTNFGDLMRIRDGRLISFLSNKDNPARGAGSFLPDPEEPGAIYFEGSDFVFYHAVFGEELTDLKVIDISPLSYVSHMEYIDGQIWICSSYGIGVLDDDGFHLPENLPMNNSVVQVMTDHLGNLWFASTRQGVMKIVPNQFSSLFDRYNLPEYVVNSTCMSDGKLFIGTDTGLIVLDDDGPVSEVPLTKAVTASGKDLEADNLITLLDGCRIRSIIRDSRDRLWISTWRKIGLVRYDHGEVTVFSQEDGLLSNSIRAVCERENGAMLVALVGGLNVIEGNRVITSLGERDGITNTEILTVAEGMDNDILLGSNGGGIYILSKTGLKNISTDDGLPSDIVMRLKKDPDHQVIWIVTSSAIAWMTPDYRVTTVKKFPYTNNFDLYENSKGDIWVLSSNGIYVTAAEDLLSGNDLNPVFYSLANGLPCITTSNSYSELTSDGDLYISGSTDICKVNIEKPYESFITAKAIVPYVEADGNTIYPDESGAFSILAGTRKLTVYPYVLNYSLTNPQISFRLDGFESGDISVSRNELGPVNYTNLVNGTYHFLIHIQDPVSQTENTVSFEISKGKEISAAFAGSVIMDITSLFFLAGILVNTSLYRKRGRLDDKLFFALIMNNLALAASELISYLSQNRSIPYVREIMIADNTVYYALLEIFPYLFLLFLDFRVHLDRQRIRKRKLLYAVPCLAFLIILVINLKTGWIFTIRADNSWHAGSLYRIIHIPMLLYLLFAQTRMYRLNIRLVFISLLILAFGIISVFWLEGISYASFMYTLFLSCTHIYVLNKPLTEETT